MMSPSPDKLDVAFTSRLTASQQKAVFHRDGPLLVIAGPGSGKTRVITCRIAALVDAGVPAHNICAITFTNKAADEMRQRAFSFAASAGAHISTFHSLCVRILRRYAANTDITPNFSIYNDSDQAKCVKQAITDCNLNTTDFSPARTLDAISTLKNKLIDADAFEKQADDFFSKTLSKIYSRYQQILKDLNAVDFDDLLMKTAFLLENNPAVRSELGNRYKYLLIDEYQDTNHAQYRIAKALASAHNNICATGDPDQSIYRWRGADIRNILDFEHDWPNAVVVRLEENFRSAPCILEVADRLIANNQSRKEKRLIATRPPAGKVVIEPYEDEVEEAIGVAENIRRLVDEGTLLSNIAIFYRVNAQSRAIEEAFIRSKIPYQIVRGVEFYNRKEIRDFLAYLKVFVNPADRVALLRIINTPARGIGKTTIDKLQNFAARRNIGLYEAIKHISKILSISKTTAAKLTAFLAMIEGFKKQVPLDNGVSPNQKSEIRNHKSSIASLAELVFSESGLEKSLAAEGKDAIANIESLISKAARYDQETENPSLIDYLQQISLFSDVDAYDTSSDRVALMTLHSAKGLEFDNVFIVGVEEGLLPHERSVDNDDETEEERRLLFVGITRAKVNLFIAFAKYRQIRGQTLRTIPSQFLFELGLAFSESANITPANTFVTPANTFVIPAQAGIHDLEPFVSSCLGGEKKHQSSIVNHKLSPRFHRGDIVVHKKFGIGTVKDFADMGDNSVVTVAFNTGQTKSLMTKFAKLTKI